MAKKVKIPLKEDSRPNSTQYGYIGNVRNQYGYSPADVDFYDDKDIYEKKDHRQAQVTDASHEEKLYRLLFRISQKLKEEEEKASKSSSGKSEVKVKQKPVASDPDPTSASRPDSKTSSETVTRESVVPISALSTEKASAEEAKESSSQEEEHTVSRHDREEGPQASAEVVTSKETVPAKVSDEKSVVPQETLPTKSVSEEKTEPIEAALPSTSVSPSSNANGSDPLVKDPAQNGPAKVQSKQTKGAVEHKDESTPVSGESEKKADKGAGSGGRIIEMADVSLDGGPERLEEENATLNKKEKAHLETHSKAKATLAGTKIGGLSTNQKKKEDAATKLDKTTDAVVEQPSEKEAEVNAGQVGKVDEAETPEVNKEDAKSTLHQALQASLPKTVEDVDKFKGKRVASKIGDKVKEAIDAKAGEITGTFEVLDKTPQPDEPRKSIPFEDIEQAPVTPDINAGNNLIPKVEESSIDLNSYLTESDNLLKKEGIKQEHLDLVDSGDLFEARKIQDTIETKAKEEPGNLRAEEKELHSKNEVELQKKEAEEKGRMQKEREAGLGSARGSQVSTKGSLEDKKKEVTDHINKIYEDVNKQVQDKLTKLKTDSLAAFDREEAAASAAFENNVNTKMEKFKDERYSGLGGKYNKVRDWFLGIDDLPQVKQIFEEEKAIYVNRIDNAISKIINDSQKVIDECKTLIGNARKEIEEYVKGLSPALQKIGEEAEKEIKKKLDELDEKVNKAAEELKEELAKKRAEAIANIEKKIEQMKEEMSGFLSKMGDLLVDAALKFFKWALETAGHSVDEIMGIINKGKAVLTAIVSDPVQFLKNLAAAVGGGVKNFGANIMKHLGEGFMNWLTGQLNSLPIQLPEKFDLKGIVSLTLQVLGLTYASLRSKLSNKVGEDKVQMAETGVELMMEVKDKGPIAMYDMMAGKADSIKNEFVEGAKEWAITNLIKQGLIRLATMINPAGAIVQAVLGIYNGIIFLVNNWDRILAFVNSVFDSIASIASGAIAQASAFVEKTMAQTIPLILDFIAQQLNLSGIAERITKIIHRIRKPIDHVIDKVIDWITKKVKKLAEKVFGKDKKGKKDKIDKQDKDKENSEHYDELDWWDNKSNFEAADHGRHTLYYKGEGPNAQLYLRSNEALFKAQLAHARSTTDPSDHENLKNIGLAESYYDSNVKPVEEKLRDMQQKGRSLRNDEKIKENEKQVQVLDQQHNAAFNGLKDHLAKIKFKDDETPTSVRTNVINGGVDSLGRATKVSAYPLTWIAGNTVGSAPSQDPVGWEHATSGERDGIYIRGHLLNDNIHGPGLRWNLTPITRTMNGTMEAQAETHGKKVLEEKSKIMFYEAKVDAYYDGTVNENDKYFPISLTVTWGELKGPDGKYDEKGSKVNVQQRTFSQGRPAMPFNINDLGETLLVSKLGLDPKFANIVNENRKLKGSYSSLRNFMERMYDLVNEKNEKIIDEGTKHVEVQNTQPKPTIIFI